MSNPFRRLSLEQLLLLNEEIRAITRSGIPLELGLRSLGGDLQGRLGDLACQMAERLERGENLSELLRSPQLNLPPHYAAVVAAGVRGGRLPAALEALTSLLRRTLELRRSLIASLVYPLLLLLVASGVFVVTFRAIWPTLYGSLLDVLEEQPPWWMAWLNGLAEHGLWILLVGWLSAGLLAIGIVGGWTSGKGAASGSGRWWSIAAIRRLGRTAMLADLLALLLEQRVEMGEALQIAGEATGDKSLRQGAYQLAEQVRLGQQSLQSPVGFPHFVCWLLATHQQSALLIPVLRLMAHSYRQTALRRSQLLSTYLPLVGSGLAGGIVSVFYALLILAPFYFLLSRLSQP